MAVLIAAPVAYAGEPEGGDSLQTFGELSDRAAIGGDGATGVTSAAGETGATALAGSGEAAAPFASDLVAAEPATAPVAFASTPLGARPLFAAKATAGQPETADVADGTTRIADPSTAYEYLNLLGTSEDGGRYTGRIWTDKSVFTDQFVSLTNPSYTVTNDQDFLIAYSALGSTRVVNGQASVPVDMVLMLDVSTSMAPRDQNQRGSGPIAEMTREANLLIDQLMKMNKDNRVAVVAYGGGSYAVMPLDHYTADGTVTIDGTSVPAYLRMEQSWENGRFFNRLLSTATGARSGKLSRTQPYFYADSTYLQGALFEGTNLLINEPITTFVDETGATRSRIPSIVVLSDGGTNIVGATRTGSTAAGSRSWDNPFVGTIPRSGGTAYYPAPNGNPFYASLSTTLNYDEAIAPRTLAVLLGAGRQKMRVEDHYKMDMQGYSIGFNITGLSRNEQEQLYATLDPATYFTANATAPTGAPDAGGVYTQTRRAFQAYQNYQAGQSPTLSFSLNGQWVSTRINASWTYNHPSTFDPVSLDDIYYIDHFYTANSANLGDIFDSIYSQLGGVAFHPATEGGSAGTVQNVGMTYTDPLGEYMDLKEFKTLRMFGVNYDVVKTSTSGTTDIYAAQLHGNGDVQVQNTSYVKPTYFNLNQVQIRVDKSNKFRQVVSIAIPEEAIPLQRETIDLGMPDADGNQTVNSYASTAGQPGSFPIRFFYTVGIHDDVKTDGKVDLGKLSAEYKAQHMDASGEVRFYANLFTESPADETAEADGALSRGDAQANFTPSKENRYYYFQKNRIIYASATGGDALTHEGVIGDAGGPTVSNPLTNLSQLRDDQNYYLVIDFYQPHGGSPRLVDFVIQRTGAELKSAVTYWNQRTGEEVSAPGTDVVVATEVGGARLGRLNRFATEKGAGESSGNVTGTADYAYLPTNAAASADADQHIETFLGNNGLLSVAPTSLRVSKRVSDVAAGLSYDHDKDYTFNMRVAGVSGDQTATVYRYDADAGQWKADGEKTRTVSFDASGQATFTLKENEALQFNGLPTGASYTVTEDKAASGLQDDRTTSGYSLLSASGVGSTVMAGDAYSLTGSTTRGRVNTADYVNTYTQTVTLTQSLPITKVLSGRDFLATDQFTFVMTPGSTGEAAESTPMPNGKTGGAFTKTLGPNLTGTKVEGDETAYEANQKLLFIGDTDKDGNAVDTITYNRPGDYVYLIREQRPQSGNSIAGVSYDATIYRMTVRVTVDEASNQLRAQPVELAVRQGGNEDYEIVWTSRDVMQAFALSFTNSYSETDVARSFQGRKVLDGAPYRGSFSFTLSALGSHPVSDESAYDILKDGSSATLEEKLAFLNGHDDSKWNTADTTQPMPGNGQEGYAFSATVRDTTSQEGMVQFAPVVYSDTLIPEASDVSMRGIIYKYSVREDQPTVDGTVDGEALPGGTENGHSFGPAQKNAEGQWVYKGVVYDNSVNTFYVWLHLDERTDETGTVVGTVVHTSVFGNMPFNMNEGAGHSPVTNRYRASASLPVVAQRQPGRPRVPQRRQLHLRHKRHGGGRACGYRGAYAVEGDVGGRQRGGRVGDHHTRERL